MAVDEKLLEKAKQNPAGLAFEDALTLAKQLGWEERKVRHGGSHHHIFHHPSAPKIKDRYPQPLNLQRGKDGKAKAYQVRQMMQMAAAMGIIDKTD
jgi:hypothetical protein